MIDSYGYILPPKYCKNRICRYRDNKLRQTGKAAPLDVICPVCGFYHDSNTWQLTTKDVVEKAATVPEKPSKPFYNIMGGTRVI